MPRKPLSTSQRRTISAGLVHGFVTPREAKLEQIQFLLGHISILTTERYLGCKQRISIMRCRMAAKSVEVARAVRATGRNLVFSLAQKSDSTDWQSAAFSAALFRSNRVFNQQLNLSEWPNYCDHSVTSADVRLSIGVQTFRKKEESKYNACAKAASGATLVSINSGHFTSDAHGFHARPTLRRTVS